MTISTKRDAHKKYTVQGFSGSRFAKTNTLVEAKRAGLAIAKKEAYRGRWNNSIMPISISKQDTPGSIYYKGYRMGDICPRRWYWETVSSY